MTAPASLEFRHETPDDLAAALARDVVLAGRWDDLTELARNEWICWMTSPKTAETRAKRLARLQEDITGGKRRPCCWPGCPHRRESARKWVAA
ncbi:YdeI/OmpD-associated family protein [Sphingomonas sp. KRR8]|uniref:YdeI/OmpD-associated family protein n=1 Tax=Sphingomonas sp. KRR8 TaxID=2942996 RepID=UPI0020217783|nr:YdeI/OmpD-associated family protein [Sphingomonas sp. KRR8]URD61418.1 YdeI/OmpD-associated family protein [Sphingomonas sp. KRR8]